MKESMILEEDGYHSIVGVRMRKVKKVRQDVLSRQGRYKTIKGNLKVKEVNHEGKRFIVCLNPEEAKGEVPQWDEIIRDLRSLQAVKIQLQGKSFLIRSEFKGTAYKCFNAVGVQPPPTIIQM